MGPSQPRSLVAAMALLAAPAPALAFTVESSLTEPCHERITLAALALAGWPDGAKPPPPTDEDGRLADDVPFTAPEDARDPWSLALQIGVRYNDLHDAAPDDFQALVFIHGDPALQREHCLRAPDDDWNIGDETALTSCRAFILDELSAALGDGDAPDLETREPVSLSLVFRGTLQVPLARFPFHLGRALHALQDSFTHSFRSPDERRVDSVLNFVEGVVSGQSYDPARDGYRHLARLDRCTDEIPGQQRRVARAVEASAALLGAIDDPTGGRAGRLARAAQVIDGYLGWVPGCTAANGWCDAAELSEPDPLGGCALGGHARRDPLGVAVVLALALLLARSRRRRSIGLALLVLAGAPSIARADDMPPPPPLTPILPAPVEQPRPPTFADGLEPAPLIPQPRAHGSYCHCVGLHVAAGASIDNTGFFADLGLRWDPSPRWMLGFDAEWNPWYSVEAGRPAAGVLNLYASGAIRLLSYRRVELRTTVRLGLSVLLFDL